MANKNGTRTIDTNKVDNLKKRFLEIYATNCNISRTCFACGIPRSTFYNWKNEDTKFANDFQEIEEAALDELEFLANHMAKSEPAVLIFLLKTKGKKRGYIEKTEVENSGSVNVQWNEEKTYQTPTE